MNAPTRVRIYKDRIIRLKRHLPAPFKKNNLAIGQEVSPEDILGEGQILSGFRTIHLASDLQVTPGEALKCLRRQKGQKIYEGELLASTKKFWGLKEKLLLAPVDGMIDFYNEKTGDLQIKLLAKASKIASGVYGLVEEIDEGSGLITIKTQATQIFGVLGSGRERGGMLKILDSAESLISPRQISEDLGGKIIIGGQILLSEVLEKAVALHIEGVVVGGMNVADFKGIAGGKWNFLEGGWRDIGVSVLVLEGFGAVPLGGDLFPILKEHEGKFALLDGNCRTLTLPNQNPQSLVAIRKTSLPKNVLPERVPEPEQEEIKEGIKVRLLHPSFLGRVGVVEKVDRSPSCLPSGIMSYLVTITTPSRKIRLPHQNLEIIG